MNTKKDINGGKLRSDIAAVNTKTGEILSEDVASYRTGAQQEAYRKLKQKKYQIASAKEEKEPLILNRCCTDAGWYNRRLTSTDRHGISNPWNQHKVNNKEKFSRTYSERYKGNRSPAMLAAHARTAELIRGVRNPAKGHKGITNAAFKPWYYITPKGEYVEVLDTTIKDMGNKLGLTTRQISNRFSSVNINKPAKTKPLKGWVFGYLPRPQTALD